MIKIQTQSGSATSPTPDTHGVIVAHLCNCVGAWGAGFVLAVNELSSAPKKAYKSLKTPIQLGTTQFVEIAKNHWVSNMIAQSGISKSGGSVLVSYQHLEECLTETVQRAISLKCNVHIPAGIGSGLAGGDKTTILAIIWKVAQSLSKKVTDFAPTITLWEFTDVSAKSYVPLQAPPTQPTPQPTSTVQQSLDAFRGIDLDE